MAINGVQRNPLTPVPPLKASKQTSPTSTEDLLEKWLPQLNSRVYAQRLDTQTSVGIASGVSGDVLILPPSYGLWLCHVSITKVNDAVNYQAINLVLSDGASARVLVTYNAPGQTIVLTGRIISSVQTTGAAQIMTGTAIQLLQFG